LFYASRCIFTNVDEITGKPDAQGQPLNTLKSYRKFDKTGESPVMGIHLGIRQDGRIKLNDAVYIDDD
jgi:uncharacterized protein